MALDATAPLTVTNLLAAVTDFLSRGRYQRIMHEETSGGWSSSSRLFEDSYGIVAVVVYDSWSEVAKAWAEDQERLVNLISSHMGEDDPKAWDGYLVLLTPGVLPSRADELLATTIRYNTSRVRKLVATGVDLRTLGQVEQVLRPLLPLDQADNAAESSNILSTLPDLLASRGIERSDTETLLDAFESQQSLMEALHETEAKQ